VSIPTAEITHPADNPMGPGFFIFFTDTKISGVGPAPMPEPAFNEDDEAMIIALMFGDRLI
jgi:hypothetical protein